MKTQTASAAGEQTHAVRSKTGNHGQILKLVEKPAHFSFERVCQSGHDVHALMTGGAGMKV